MTERIYCFQTVETCGSFAQIQGTRNRTQISLFCYHCSMSLPFAMIKERPTLKSSSSKSGTCQDHDSFTLAHQTLFQKNQHLQTCMASPWGTLQVTLISHKCWNAWWISLLVNLACDKFDKYCMQETQGLLIRELVSLEGADILNAFSSSNRMRPIISCCFGDRMFDCQNLHKWSSKVVEEKRE